MSRAGNLVLVLIVTLGAAARAGADVEPRAAGVIVVGTGDYNPPFGFRDANGDPTGHDVDLVRAVAEATGMKVRFRLGHSEDVRQELEEGRVDLLAAISFDSAAASKFELSDPYCTVDTAIYARAGTPPVSGLDQLAGKEVIVQRESPMRELLMAKGFKRELVLVPNQTEALRLLASGHHDYAVVGALAGAFAIHQFELTNLKQVARDVEPIEQVGFAARKGDRALIDTFNEGLATLRANGRYAEIHRRWLEPPDEGIPWQLLLRYWIYGPLPLLVLLAAGGLWTRTLRRQVARRTSDLQREVSVRTEAEAQLRRNQEALVQADKLAALGVLVSGVAHEINNPAGVILLNLPVLRRVTRDAMAQLETDADAPDELGGLPFDEARNSLPRMLDDMQAGATRIKRIVADLKSLGRSDEGAQHSPQDLNAIVETSVRLTDSTLRKATEHIELQLSPGLPLVSCNAQRIEQVAINLLLNACQALPSTDRSVRVRTALQADPPAVQLVVEDEGTGIAPENLSRITDPFFTTKRTSGGTGLGLSVSAGIIKEHGGTLHFASELGRGTTVTVTLPLAEA